MQFRVVSTTLGNSHVGKKLRGFMETVNLDEDKFTFASKSKHAGKIKICEYSWYEEKGHTLLGEYLYDFMIENDLLTLVQSSIK
jgi:hypothetical protein